MGRRWRRNEAPMQAKSIQQQQPDRRRIERHHLPYYLQVYNRITDRLLGYVVNISPQGMMLVSKNRLLTHAMFALEFRLPDILSDKEKIIPFEALSHWCHPDVTPSCYDTGFSFSHPPAELTQVVDDLTEYFKFKIDNSSL
jgi:hypothetical protein